METLFNGNIKKYNNVVHTIIFFSEDHDKGIPKCTWDFMYLWLTGEGFSGTAIKDTWTKPRGMVEAKEGGGFDLGGGEWWGENADNCNWTTIFKI